MLHLTFRQSWVRLKARKGSDKSTAKRVIMEAKLRCNLYTTLKLYTSLSICYLIHYIHGAEDPIVIILTFKIRAWSRPNSNKPLFRGRMLSYQNVPEIEWKNCKKIYVLGKSIQNYFSRSLCLVKKQRCVLRPDNTIKLL
jgi:hypothetical protein